MPKLFKRKKLAHGRPTKYTAELEQEICERIMSGESLNQIISSGEHIPSISTIYLWRKLNPDFDKAILDARERQAETFFDALLDVAQDGKVEVSRARLIIDTLSKMAERYNPTAFQPSHRVDNRGEMTVLAPEYIKKENPQGMKKEGEE